MLMVGANTIPYLLVPPAPLWLRAISSIAAPTFILLSGMMVALSVGRKNYDLWYFLSRGIIVVLLAAALQVATWGSLPFIDMDVLYLIGISLPIAYFFLKLEPRVRWIVIGAIFCLAPVFQVLFGYGTDTLHASATALMNPGPFPGLMEIIHQWLIDGWFPVFPWLGISLLGAQLGTIRWKGGTVGSFATKKIVAIALGLIATGTACMALFPGPLYTRDGYVELFYPPTIGFLLAVSGVVIGLFVLADMLPPRSRVTDPLRALGECSLAIYLLHSLVIAWIISPLGLSVSLPGFIVVFGIFVTGMIGVAYILRSIRPGSRKRSLIIRMLIGG